MKTTLYLASLIFFLSACWFSHAQPVVTGVRPQTLQDRQTLDITGYGFGSKSPAAPQIWDDFDWGQDGDPLTDNGWIIANSANIAPEIDTAMKYSGTGSAYAKLTEGISHGVWRQCYKTFTPSLTVYVFFKIRYHIANSEPFSGVWKVSRVCSEVPYSGAPRVLGTFQPGWLRVGIDYANTHGNMKPWIPDKWYRLEYMCILSDPPDASNGYLNAWVDSQQAGNDPYYPIPYFGQTRTSAKKFDNFMTAHMWPLLSAPYAEVWMDDIYVDITRARVEIGDAATWEACTHREIQIPSAWSDTSITVTVNQGSFENGAQVYLYVVDADGNVNAQGFPITFAGVPQPLTDLTPPFVSGQSPAPGDKNVPVNSSIVLHIQDSGDGVDVNSIQMQVNGQLVAPLQTTGSPSDYTVTYTAGSPFADDSVVTVTVNAQDLHSPPNVMQQVTYSFTTQAGDSTPPVVTGQSPAPDQQNVPVDTIIVLHVQDSGDGVDVNSIQMQVNGESVTPQITGSPSDYTVTYTPGSPFGYDNVVTVAVNAQDLHAPPNVMQQVTYSFTTDHVDSTPPVVTGQSPAPNQQNVSVDTSIVLHVQDSGDGVDVDSIQMQVNGQPVTPQVTGSPSDYTGTYTPGSPFAYDSIVTVIVNSQDLHDPPNVMSAVTYSFHTQPEGAVVEEWGDATNSDHPGTLEDTFINIDSQNYAADPTSLNTYTWPANSIANAILMKFDLSAIPQNATVISAKLRLYMFEASSEPTYNISVHKIVNVTPVIAAATGYTYDGTNPWTPYEGLYENIPLGQSDIAAPEDTNAVDTTPGYKEWTVTTIVSEWVADPSSNRAFMLNSDPGAPADAYRYFRPSEYADAAQRPRLVISYIIGSAPIPGPPGKPIHVD